MAFEGIDDPYNHDVAASFYGEASYCMDEAYQELNTPYGDSKVAADFLLQAAEAYYQGCDYGKVIEALELALPLLALETGEEAPGRMLLFHYLLAYAYLREGEGDKSLPHFLGYLALWRAGVTHETYADEEREAWVLLALVSIYMEKADYGEALRLAISTQPWMGECDSDLSFLWGFNLVKLAKETSYIYITEEEALWRLEKLYEIAVREWREEEGEIELMLEELKEYVDA